MYENSKWCVVSDVEPAVLTVTGACEAASPAAPVLGENLQLWIQTYTGGNSPKSGAQVDRQPTTYGPSLEYGEVVYDEDEGVWTCELTVTGYTDDPELADYCYVNRMSGDYIVVGDAVKTVTLTYNQGTGKWVAPALPLTVTGGSTVKYGVAFLVTQDTGETLPDLPNTTNCKDFYVTVYGYEPQSDGTTVNKVLHSSTWGGYPSYVTVVFGVPQKGADGVWTCEATVDATARVEQQLEYFANSHYRLDKSEKTVKDVTLTYNEATGKWSAPSDGVTYGYPSSPQYKNGVAFELIKQYVITYEPGRDLSFGAPVGEAYEEDPTDAGDYIRLPDEVPFTTENGYFAGWTQSLNGGTVFYTPGQSIPMFAADTTLKAAWMDVELAVADQPYDPSLTAKDYTFSDGTAPISADGDSVTLLFKATIKGNSEYQYDLICIGGTAVLDTTLKGSIAKYQTTAAVYFTKTFTLTDGALSQQVQVSLRNTDAAAVLTVGVEPSDPAPTLDASTVNTPYVYVSCGNEEALHPTIKTKNYKAAYTDLTFGQPQKADGVWTVTGTLTDEAVAAYGQKFIDSYASTLAHSNPQGANASITFQYDEDSGKWVADSAAEARLTVTVTCDLVGPMAPGKSNCTDFYVTVYGYQPQADGTVRNMSLASGRWDLYLSQASVEFGQPQQGEDGVWTCEATVDATTRVQNVLNSQSNYRLDESEPMVKTVTLTYNATSGKWVAAGDGVTYGYPSNPEYKNGVAYQLIKQYVVTYDPGRDLGYGIPAGEAFKSEPMDAGASLTLPDEVPFTTEKGYFAGWTQSLSGSIAFYAPGETISMFAGDTKLSAAWMDVEVSVAEQLYDPDLALKDYTFSAEGASLKTRDESAALLYKVTVKGNSQYDYSLVCPGAEAVFDTSLEGSIAKYQTTATVYFIKSYTVDDGDTLTAAVSLDKCAATASAAASIQWGPGQLTLDAAGPDLVYTGSDVTYTLQGVGRSSDVSTVRFSFRISGSFDPDSVKLSALNGFVMASAQPEAGEDGVVYTVILTPGAAAALAEDKVTDLLQISLTAGSEAGQITVTPLSITYTPDIEGEDYVGLAGEALSTTVWTRYDINGDGKVTLSDVNMLKVYYQSTAGDDNWGQARVADLNDDGVVDVEDLTILMQYLLTI